MPIRSAAQEKSALPLDPRHWRAMRRYNSHVMLEGDSVERALGTLGGLLEQRGLEYEIVVVGGGALLLLGIIRRPTKDVDVLALVDHGQYITAQPLPRGLEQAVGDVADVLGLARNWLNGGPTAQIRSGLPEGFKDRVDTRTYRTLVVHVASRVDHIFLKLFAAVDQWPVQGKHVDDLRRLAPTRQELLEAARWVRGQDTGPEFPRMVAAVLKALGAENAETQP